MNQQNKLKDQLAALSLFNEKSEKLKRCSFTRLVFEHESGISFSAKINEAIKIQRMGVGPYLQNKNMEVARKCNVQIVD